MFFANDGKSTCQRDRLVAMSVSHSKKRTPKALASLSLDYFLFGLLLKEAA